MRNSIKSGVACEIDIVIPWVDDSDPEWLKSRNSYRAQIMQNRSQEKNEDSRYRDWGILKYVFRSIEKYAPWVRRVHFVTCGQKPEWLNTEHPKLHVVNHEDYIPAEYLPTFSANPIELNFHRIEGLSEHFVYFNDDMFLTAPTVSSDFFVNGLPCDSAIVTPQIASIPGHPFIHYLINDLAVINGHFDLRKAVLMKPGKWFHPVYGKYLIRNFLFSLMWGKACGFYNFHMPTAMLKSTFEQVWNLEPRILEDTCRNRFRGLNDVNQYVMSYTNFCQNRFVPRSPKYGHYFTIGENREELFGAITNRNYKYICVNDSEKKIDFEYEKDLLIEAFEKAFPEKSRFEI